MVDYSIGHYDAFAAFVVKSRDYPSQPNPEQEEDVITDRQKNYIFHGDISQIHEYNDAIEIGLRILEDAINREWHIVTDDTPISFVMDSKAQFRVLEELDDYDAIEMFRKHNAKYYYGVSNTLTNWALRRIHDIGGNSRKSGNISCLNTPMDNLLVDIGLCSRKCFIPWHTNKFRPEITVDNLKQQGILNLYVLSRKYKNELRSATTISTPDEPELF